GSSVAVGHKGGGGIVTGVNDGDLALQAAPVEGIERAAGEAEEVAHARVVKEASDQLAPVEAGHPLPPPAASPLTTGWMARMCSGPVAQQPPMIWAPCSRQSRANSA